MILIAGSYNVHGSAEGTYLIQNVATTFTPNSPAFTQLAVESTFPGLGKPFIALALFFFSFTTILAYYYIAETNVAYLHRTIRIPGMTTLLKVMMLASVVYGTVKAASLAWGMGDIGVGLMAWLNIIGILIIFALNRPALKALKDYEEQQKQGVTEYKFDPVKLGIKNADYWESRLAAGKGNSSSQSNTQAAPDSPLQEV